MNSRIRTLFYIFLNPDYFVARSLRSLRSNKARFDWLKQLALSESRAPVDNVKLAFKFSLWIFDKFDPNYTFPVT